MPRTVEAPTLDAIRAAVVAVDAADVLSKDSADAFHELAALVGTVAAYRARMRLRDGGVDAAVATAVKYSGLFGA